jgi:diguanylate cyclase (GGDEF)-like protein/PAS domain S-box-containing protein
MKKQEEASLPPPDTQRRDPELLNLLANALEAANTAVAIVDRDRTIVWANPAVEPLSGFTPQDIIGKRTPLYWSSRQTPAFYDALWHKLLSGQEWRGELINRRKDGSFYDEERTITPIKDAQGEVTHFIAIGLDISERKRAENEIRWLAQVVEKTSNLVGMTDLDGKFFFVNPRFCEATGRHKEDLLGAHFSIVMAESNPPQLIEEITRTGPAGWTGEVQLRRKDGAEFSVHLILQPLTDREDQVIGRFGIARDITEIKRAEEALRQSHEMFEALFESSPDAMLAVDVNGRIERLNAQAERLFGYKRRELLGGLVETLVPGHFRLAHPDRSQDASADPHAHFAPFDAELRGRRKDGSEFPVEISLSLLQTNSGTLVLSVIRDVTLRKEADQALKEAHARLNIALRNVERQSREAAKLSELVDVLQSCPSLREAYEVTAETLKAILPCVAGAVCILNELRNVEVVASWGGSQATEKTFRPDGCWALRRSKVHQVKDAGAHLRCAHVHPNPPGGYFCVPLVAQGEAFGVLYLEYPPEPPTSLVDPPPKERRSDHVDIEVRQVTALGERLSLALGNLRLREALRTQSIRDPLTNLFNRRYMEETLERELSRAARTGQPVALLMLDIDHFKRFNDTFGHQGGDALLRALGNFLIQRTRGHDVACRYGGEEFAIILAGASKEAASRRAQILHDELKHMIVENAGQIVGQVTFSTGIAVAPEHGTSAGELVRVADASLYRAKAEGRDRIVVA